MIKKKKRKEKEEKTSLLVEVVVDAMITRRRLSELRGRPCNLVIKCGPKKDKYIYVCKSKC